jgi:HEAT repeat protein/TolA-binding protein
MKRITLAVLSLVAASAVGVAQEPPTPPTPPAPTPRPMPAPRLAPLPTRDYDYRFDQEQVREIQRQAQEMARENMRIDQQHVREMAQEASRMALENSRIDIERVREQARIDARDFAYAMPMEIPTPRIAPMPAMPMIAPTPMIAPMAPFAYGRGDFTNRLAPAPWIQGDPADSVYRIARDALNNGDYGRAARLFGELVSKYQKSQYQDAGMYYQALARYKIGTTDELHQAARILEPMVAKLPARTSGETRAGAGEGFGRGQYATTYVFNGRSGFSDSEVAALYNRVNGALAQRGDRDAAAKVAKAGNDAGSAPCDRDDIDVRTEALNALATMDGATALPALKRVLERKDDCSAQLRRSAVFMLGRRADAESSTLLISVAKSDPNIDVRISAINYLSKLPGDVGINALEDMLRTDQDERIQRAAIRALNSSDNVRARSGMRALIDRKDAPANLRIEAINSFASDRTTNDDAAYLRGLYPKAENDRTKEAILNSISRIGGADNDQFVLNVAKNPNESSQLRSSALSRLSRSPSVTSADWSKIYDAADSYDVRSRIVQILSNRKDPESADKLIDIAKTSTVVSLRKEALNAITRRNDPRAQQLLQDILDGKKP